MIFCKMLLFREVTIFFNLNLFKWTETLGKNQIIPWLIQV